MIESFFLERTNNNALANTLLENETIDAKAFKSVLESRPLNS
jgi:ATP-dependent Zn protease